MYKKIQKNLNVFLIGLGSLYFLYLVRGILLPFVLGIFVAYLLHSINDKLENKIKNRTLSSIIIISIFYLVVIALLTFFIPMASDQLLKLFKELAIFINNNNSLLYERITKLLEHVGIHETFDMKNYIAIYGEKLTSYSINLLNSLLSKSIAIITVISLLIITPITSFHFLNQWNNIINKIKSYFPKDKAQKYSLLFKEIDKTLSGCLKGQLTVCFILGVLYGVSLMLINLKYGFVIGFLTGIANFIPYFGMFVGCSIAFAMTIYQFGFNISYIFLVLGIFIIGQILEANFLTPNLVGDKVNLHPMWIIFAIFCGSSLFGFYGLLLAVPIAGILGVLVKFYLKNRLKNK